MSPTPSQNGKPTPKTNTTPNPAKLEVVEPSSAPTSQAAEAPTPKKEESEPTRPYTITVPVRILKQVALLSKASGVPTSAIWLEAIENAGLRDKVRAALAQMQADLDE